MEVVNRHRRNDFCSIPKILNEVKSHYIFINSKANLWKRIGMQRSVDFLKFTAFKEFTIIKTSTRKDINNTSTIKVTENKITGKHICMQHISQLMDIKYIHQECFQIQFQTKTTNIILDFFLIKIYSKNTLFYDFHSSLANLC